MAADTASADNNIPTIVTNRLFLSHIDYTNHNTTENGDEISTEIVRQKLDRLFSKYGLVLEIYLSDKEDPNMLRGKDNHRPPFGFIAMETAHQAQAALNALSNSSQQQQKDKEINDSQNFDRHLFRDVAPAHVHNSKQNKQNKNERLRSERLAEYRKRLLSIDQTNLVCQVHSSHLDRMQDFVLERKNVELINSFSAQKGTSLLFLRVEDEESSESVRRPSNNVANTADDKRLDHLQRFSRLLWETWFVAPNLNRITLLNTHKERVKEDNDGYHTVQGNIRTGVVPAIYRSLSQIKPNGSADNEISTKVSLRVAIFPPKLQRNLLEGLEDYNQKRKDKSSPNNDPCKDIDVQFSPGNPTHTISIIQVHPGVVVTPRAKGDNDKALYILGRLETTTETRRKRSLSDDNNNEDNTYRFQQQRTSQVPQLGIATHNSRLKNIDNNSNTIQSKDDNNIIRSDDDKSISRAYWKLQEAWERYKYKPPSLSDNSREEPMWALDCGAAPGGWTKFLFRPGIVERVYAIDPGKLSPEVVPGLDEANQNHSTSPSSIIQYMDTTIQKALPKLALEFKEANRKNPFLDIWVSDMCVKDMSGQIDCFLEARSQEVVGPGTFFVLTLKCVVGYTATAFDHQAGEQVKRLDGISRDVHVLHLFSNRNSERTIIGYLI